MPALPFPPLEPDCFYHIYNRANGNENIFREHTNYEYFLKLYSAYIPPIADTFAFCLMPNHFHFAVRVKPEKELVNYYQMKGKALERLQTVHALIQYNSQQYSNLFNAYAQAFNKKYARRGGLFISNFKRKKVTSITSLRSFTHENLIKSFCRLWSLNDCSKPLKGCVISPVQIVEK